MKKFAFLAITMMLTACSIPSDINNRQAFFELNSAEISRDARRELKSQAEYLKRNPETKIVIQGHCDERGSTEYNLALGALRAGNAAHAIIHEGIEPNRIRTVSYGKNKPSHFGTGEKIWSKNRNTTTIVE
jgi:peptidoglycan-associated lipoprotein